MNETKQDLIRKYREAGLTLFDAEAAADAALTFSAWCILPARPLGSNRSRFVWYPGDVTVIKKEN